MSNIKEILNKVADNITDDMKAIIKLNGAMASGTLYNTLRANVIEGNNSYRIQITYPFYGKFIDEGRSPGKMPPIKDIIEWTRLKGIPESAAFPIAKSIGKNGFKGINFTRVIYDKENKDALKKAFETEYTKFITTELIKK
jgi:hypothetical protein